MSAGRLLEPGDPPPFRAWNAEGSAPILLVCDHAANAVPRRLGALGLTPEELGRHIGWDIGAEGVTRRLAERLGARAIVTSFSRLVIDCNRSASDPTVILDVSDGTSVPGNVGLAAADRAARFEEIYWPYHRAIDAELDRLAARGVGPALLSIHSFTPRLYGVDRPWQIGVLWDRDPRIPAPLLRSLAEGAGLVVGDNEPYSDRDDPGFTLHHHAASRGLPHTTIEIRQDEITSAEGQARYAELLADALSLILADAALFRALSPATRP